MRVAIIGAGMAGLACAEALPAAAHRVTLFDKGRAAGGRMSTRRVATAAGEAAFDHGAQYFTARDPAFRRRVRRWAEAGQAAMWPAAGPDAWVGVPAMSAPVRQMASGLDVRVGSQVAAMEREGPGWRIEGATFDAAVVAVPAEQAAVLMKPWQDNFVALAAGTPALPCWTLMAAFAEAVPVPQDVFRGADDDAVGWAARNTAKPGRAGPESWVVQAGPDWSRAHLELDAAEVTALLLDAFARRIGVALPKPLSTASHRWRYARSGVAGRSCLWDPEQRLGVCGDWLMGPRVEAAWLSGTALAAAMAGGTE